MNYERIMDARREFDILKARVEEKRLELFKWNSKLPNIERGQAICQTVAEETQSKLSVQLDNLINLALDTCFPDTYNFHLAFITNRGKTEVKFTLVDKRNNKEIDDIINACGGGLVDLVSFALRLAFLTLSNVDKVLILDEPFRFLSQDLRSKAAELMKTLCDELGLQIICITHIPEVMDVADKLFVVKKIDGVSNVEEVC